jgi:ubiquinone/menaquinone biosynthesis C-methylase UbiE
MVDLGVLDEPSDVAHRGVRSAALSLRPFATLVVGAFAVATLTVGIVTTAVVLAGAGPRTLPAGGALWLALALGAAATYANLSVRAVRWWFLLRRANPPIRLQDAYIAYLAGFGLLFVPFLVGEITVRARILRSRAMVPMGATAIVNLWERLLDVSALAVIAGLFGVVIGFPAAVLTLAIPVALAVQPIRRLSLRAATAASNAVVSWLAPAEQRVSGRQVEALISSTTWWLALAASVVAWMLPAVTLWAIAAAWHEGIDPIQAQIVFAWSSLRGAFTLAPAGISVVGSSLLTFLADAHATTGNATAMVFAVRLATAGFAIAVGVVFVWLHRTIRPLGIGSHFDSIADAYDVQIPVAQRERLLTLKTRLMRDAIDRWCAGRKGLDVGCGQGRYVARMRQLGYDVHGSDPSVGQIRHARVLVGDATLIKQGSALRIDAADGTYDFAYVINVLHHLASVEEQQKAFAELLRVIKPGGLLFVHEINTRNILFRFYMGYVFPSVNCIDEGTERWLLPHRLQQYVAAPVIATEFFTFLPEFAPAMVLRLCRPMEALLEASPLRIFSAHYMAVLRKPGVE